MSRFFLIYTAICCVLSLPNVAATTTKRYLRPKSTKVSSTRVSSTKAPSVKSSKSSTSSPSAAPTIDCLKDIEVDDVLEILLTVSDECLLVTPGTPQNNAYQWILDDDIATSYTNPEDLLQRYALAALYYTTNENSNLNSWLDHSVDECDEVNGWKYLTCEDDRVVSLLLFDKGLTGTIPVELLGFSYLTNLDLAKNALTGTIPTELAGLSNLWHMALGPNSLTGTIPTELGLLSTYLATLNLLENNLGGTIPTELGNISNMRYFRANDNAFTGTIPTELGNLPSLLELRLQGNVGLTQSLPDEVCDIATLGTVITDWCSPTKADCCPSP